MDMLDLKMNGMKPFLSHRDGLNERLDEGHALLQIVAQAFRDAWDAKERGGEGGLLEINPDIMARAFEGIATLIALAQHHNDNVDSDGERAAVTS